jgi:hypothetical protein
MDTHSLLKHSQFGHIINTVSLKLEMWSRQYDHWKHCQQSKSEKTPCACDELDVKLGSALNNLPRLRVLRVYCFLCEVGSYERHWYIATLQTRVLREIKFTCTCSTMDEIKVAEFFSAPCMTSVTTLGWYFRGGTSAKEGHLDACLGDKAILPNLRSLYYGGDELNSHLLRHRPIQRLSSTSTAASNPLECDELIKKRSVLTHVSIHDSNVVNGLLGAIFMDPLPFRNLQHIGSLSLNSPRWRVGTHYR